MKKNILFTIAIVCMALFGAGVFSLFATESGDGRISGQLVHGYRILALPAAGEDVRFTVYRGDYIKFDLGDTANESLLAIPAMAIQQSLKGDFRQGPYFKMKETGTFPFTLGTYSGEIEVIEFDRPQYGVLTADEAARLIRNISPVILDVRTPQEYSTGHMENSILIPVQELQQRYGELDQYRNTDVFIYCATGNRSTVAAKILIDNGFTRVYNLRYGIGDWQRNGYPVMR